MYHHINIVRKGNTTVAERAQHTATECVFAVCFCVWLVCEFAAHVLSN